MLEANVDTALYFLHPFAVLCAILGHLESGRYILPLLTLLKISVEKYSSFLPPLCFLCCSVNIEQSLLSGTGDTDEPQPQTTEDPGSRDGPSITD